MTKSISAALTLMLGDEEIEVEIKVFVQRVDDSFDHAFGTECLHHYEYEFDSFARLAHGDDRREIVLANYESWEAVLEEEFEKHDWDHLADYFEEAVRDDREDRAERGRW